MVLESSRPGPDAIASIAHPLQADGGRELDDLVDLVARKRLVLIGGASHGTHEFHAMRAALTRSLVDDHGYAAVCVEGDWPDALRVDRYVRGQGDDDDAIEALGAFERFPRWMWRNPEVAEHVEWLRVHNRRRPERKRVGFYGLDLYSMHASMRAVVQYLADNDPEAAARARARYACFDHPSEVEPAIQEMKAHLGVGPHCENEAVAQLVELQVRKLARSGRSPAGDAWFHALQQAHVVRNAEAYYRTMFAGRSASWNLRDTHMADTLDMLAEHLGDGAPAKLVVWAHNSHVGDARATEMGDDGQLSLGQLARQRHPGEVALIGFTTHTGSVLAASDWDGPPHVERVRPSLDRSWEELFHDSGVGDFYVTAGDLARRLGESSERIKRAIGLVYLPATERRSHYFHARLAEELDIVVHLDETRAVTSLDSTSSPDHTPERELPDTYPSGV